MESEEFKPYLTASRLVIHAVLFDRGVFFAFLLGLPHPNKYHSREQQTQGQDNVGVLAEYNVYLMCK